MTTHANYGSIPQEDPDFPVNISRPIPTPVKLTNIKQERIIFGIAALIIILILLFGGMDLTLLEEAFDTDDYVAPLPGSNDIIIPTGPALNIAKNNTLDSLANFNATENIL